MVNIVNPDTGRQIKKGGPTHKKLIDAGILDERGNTLLGKGESVKPNKKRARSTSRGSKTPKRARSVSRSRGKKASKRARSVSRGRNAASKTAYFLLINNNARLDQVKKIDKGLSDNIEKSVKNMSEKEKEYYVDDAYMKDMYEGDNGIYTIYLSFGVKDREDEYKKPTLKSVREYLESDMKKKRAKSSYEVFKEDNFDAVKKAYPNLSIMKIFSKVNELWGEHKKKHKSFKIRAQPKL